MGNNVYVPIMCWQAVCERTGFADRHGEAIRRLAGEIAIPGKFAEAVAGFDNALITLLPQTTVFVALLGMPVRVGNGGVHLRFSSHCTPLSVVEWACGDVRSGKHGEVSSWDAFTLDDWLQCCLAGGQREQ